MAHKSIILGEGREISTGNLWGARAITVLVLFLGLVNITSGSGTGVFLLGKAIGLVVTAVFIYWVLLLTASKEV
jgi:hypothetical protein